MGYLTSMKSFQEQDGPLRAFCEKHLPVSCPIQILPVCAERHSAPFQATSQADGKDEFRKEDVLAMSDPESDYSPSTASSPHKRHAKHPPSGLGSGSGPLIKKARGGNAFKKAQNAPIPLVMPTSVTTKTARAHAKSYRPGPPIVPNIIVQSVIDYVAKIAIRKRVGLVERVCRYWSLKREARRGAPLLKRLHLEVSLLFCVCLGRAGTLRVPRHVGRRPSRETEEQGVDGAHVAEYSGIDVTAS